MKKFITLLLLLPLMSNAGLFDFGTDEKQEIKIFKDYPFDMRKDVFLTKFPSFGECEFNRAERICAPAGYETLYGTRFNIVIKLDKKRTSSILLKPTEYSMDRVDFWELFRGLLKSGFVLYQVKDENGTGNMFDDLFESAKKREQIDSLSPKLDVLESNKSTQQTLYYIEKSKLDLVLKGNKFTSRDSIMDKLPKETRFIEMSVHSIKGESYFIELTMSIPNLQVSSKDDRPVEKF